MDKEKVAQYVNVLRRADVFYDLNEAHLQKIASICSEVEYKAQEMLFEENTPGDELYVIASGAVEILLNPSLVQPGADQGGDAVTVATLIQGQNLGEITLVDQGLRTASARAAGRRTRLLIIPRDKLIDLLEQEPELGYRVMRNVAADLAFKIRGTDLMIREQLLWRPRRRE
jgi:CRP-like cAMP-binding protein